jgi:hypothetical protein
MAPFEEKVLAYLDGSLSGADADEVMRAASISPDRRAVLDAHLRLNDLFKIVQKPISAPLWLQRDLASKVPVLAAKLPYLAAETPRRRYGAIFGFFGRTAGGFGSSRASTIGAIVIALALVGGIWLAVDRSGDHLVAVSGSGNGSNGSNGTGATNGSAMSSGPVQSNGSAVAPDRTNQSDQTDKSHKTYGSHEASSSIAGMGSLATAASATPTANSASHHTTHNLRDAGPGRTAHTGNIGGAHNLANQAPHAGQGANIPALQEPATPGIPQGPNGLSNGAGDHNLNNGNNQNIASALTPPASPAPPQQEPPPADISSVSSLQSAATLHVSHGIPIQYSVPANEGSYSPFHAFASSGARALFRPNVSLSENVTSNGIGAASVSPAISYEAGLDYEISPWLSAGIRVGQTSFLQLQPFINTQKLYGTLTQKIADDSIGTVSAPWVGFAFSYQLNPEDPLHFGTTIFGGAALVSGATATSPMAMVELNAGYELSTSFTLRGALSIDIARISPINTTPNPSPGSSTLGIITAGSTNALTSSAVGINVGIVFHP